MKFTYELRLSEHKFSYAFCGPVFMYQVVMNVTNECMHITMQCARRTVYLTTCSLVVGHWSQSADLQRMRLLCCVSQISRR